MDRFKILKGIDPFKKNPNGDGRKYHFSTYKFRGWLIEDPNILEGTCPYPASIILEVPENFSRYITTLNKKLEIEIESKNKFEIFVGQRVRNSSYCSTKGKMSRVHFMGSVVKIRTPNYIVGEP